MSELFKKIEKLEQKRKELFSSYTKFMTIAVVSILTAILLSILSEFYFLFVVGLIPAFIFFSKAQALSKQFKNTIKDELVHIVLEDKFDEVFYDRHQSISKARSFFRRRLH